jgi:hypothetical protein
MPPLAGPGRRPGAANRFPVPRRAAELDPEPVAGVLYGRAHCLARRLSPNQPPVQVDIRLGDRRAPHRRIRTHDQLDPGEQHRFWGLP